MTTANLQLINGNHNNSKRDWSIGKGKDGDDKKRCGKMAVFNYMHWEKHLNKLREAAELNCWKVDIICDPNTYSVSDRSWMPVSLRGHNWTGLNAIYSLSSSVSRRPRRRSRRYILLRFHAIYKFDNFKRPEEFLNYHLFFEEKTCFGNNLNLWICEWWSSMRTMNTLRS